MRARRPPAKRGLRARPWLLLPLLLAVGVVVWAAWPQPPVPPSVRPLDALYRPDGGLREELAIRVIVRESPSTRDDAPCFEVQLGDRSWTLYEPALHLSIPETTEAWKGLHRQYEDFQRDFEDAIEAVREAEPQRCFGVITVDAPVDERWPAAVEIVQDAFIEAGVPDSILEPPTEMAWPSTGR